MHQDLWVGPNVSPRGHQRLGRADRELRGVAAGQRLQTSGVSNEKAREKQMERKWKLGLQGFVGFRVFGKWKEDQMATTSGSYKDSWGLWLKSW